MTAMNSLINVPEVQANMMNMAKEMEKSGMIGEIMQEALDDALEVDESAGDNEVDNVLYEVTAGIMGTAPEVANKLLPKQQQAEVAGPSTTVANEIDEDDVAARLAGLRS